MWIVRLALNRPYTFIVLALLILLASPVVIMRTPTDIFPNINIPVIAVAWQFTGLNPEEMEFSPRPSTTSSTSNRPPSMGNRSSKFLSSPTRALIRPTPR